MLLSINLHTIPQLRHLGYVEYTEPWMHFSRKSDEYILYIIKSGRMYINEDGNDYVLRDGDFFLLEPYKLHVGYKKSCCNYYYVHFKHNEITISHKTKEQIIQEMLSRRQISLVSDHFSEKSFTTTTSYIPKKYNIINKIVLLDIFNCLKIANDDYYSKYEDYKLFASCKLNEVLIKISREFLTSNTQNNAPQLPRAYIKVQEITDHLNNEYHKKINSSDIEELVELNYDYINRVFQKVTGLSIFNYLNIVRINKAKELIANTTLKVSDIAYLVGIDDQYYFSRLFKQYTGVPPTKFITNR